MIGFQEVKSCVLAAVIFACLAMALPSTSMADLREQSDELAAIAEQVKPALVTVFISERGGDPDRSPRRYFRRWRWPGDPSEPFPEWFPEQWRWRGEGSLDLFEKDEEGKSVLYLFNRKEAPDGIGTGIIMDREGHIVTTSHLVEDSRDRIRVRLADKREFKAKLVAADPDSGVAVIKIDAEDLAPAEPGDSDSVRIGELVMAFGNLQRQGVAVTMGVVSATGRTGLGITTYENFIQTDASIDSGSGGGALVNASGEVVGMILARHSEGSAGFAVPINTVIRVMDDLVSEGKVRRGWLGVHIQEVSAELVEKIELGKPRGALVAATGGPAAEAGIEPGDVIIEFDGETIKGPAHLKDVVARARPDSEVAVTVVRKGEEKKLTARLGERTEESVKALDKRKWKAQETGSIGIAVQELTPELAEKFGYEGEEGVLISDVRTGSHAQEKGLREGDLIQEVEGESIRSVKDFEGAVKAAGNSILLRIRRDDQTWYEVIKVESD